MPSGQFAGKKGKRAMRVLIADDDPISRRLLERTLQHWGYEVTAARDGAEAWRFFQERDYPLVISDWVMPGMDGLELVRRIRASSRPGYVYILLLAAASHRREVVEGMNAGADDFVSKPFDRDELRVRLRAGQRVIDLEQKLVEQNRDLRERNADMEADLRMACEVQQALLPQAKPSFPSCVPPERSRLGFAERYLPNGAVGGDFFDVLSLSDTKAGIFICDVMGHGVRAALVTATVRALLETLRVHANDPELLLADMNRDMQAIFGQASVPVFLSAFYATMDTLTGEFRYANAGHPAPRILRRQDSEVLVLPMRAGQPGPPLGVRNQATYSAASFTLYPSDLVVLYTDGVYEQVGPNMEQFGEKRVDEVLSRCLHSCANRIFDELLAEVKRFAQGRSFCDDVCLLGMEVRAIGGNGGPI
jgi:sigma-B regulation protein RsbU (phosphoserine phosphatase)